MKNQKGITLIALVITIIVLLILAGITIAMLTGENGILNKARDSKAENELGRAKDAINLAASDGISDYYKTTYVNATTSQSYSNNGVQRAVATKINAANIAPVTLADLDVPEEGATASDINFTISYNEVIKYGTLKANGAIVWSDTAPTTTTTP